MMSTIPVQHIQIITQSLGSINESFSCHSQIRLIGGMTNKNYHVKTDKNREVIIRIPGPGSDILVSRKSEFYNTQLVNQLPITPKTLYFNPIDGIKITHYIPDTETLSAQTCKATLETSLSLLKTLHTSELDFYSKFDVFTEYHCYRTFIKNTPFMRDRAFINAENCFYKIKSRLLKLGLEKKPCHIDTIPENFIKTKNRMFLVDWEYSGMNDPFWDLSVHFFEAGLNEQEKIAYLNHYLEREATAKEKEKLFLFEICHHLFWFLWVVIKEEYGDNFGDYGMYRFSQAQQSIKQYFS